VPLNFVVSASSNITEHDNSSKKSDIMAYIQNGELHVSNLTNNELVCVYDILGKLVCQSIADSDKLKIALPQTHGIYIIRQSTRTIKIVYYKSV
jgi:uncharacterized membrane protein